MDDDSGEPRVPPFLEPPKYRVNMCQMSPWQVIRTASISPPSLAEEPAPGTGSPAQRMNEQGLKKPMGPNFCPTGTEFQWKITEHIYTYYIYILYYIIYIYIHF